MKTRLSFLIVALTLSIACHKAPTTPTDGSATVETTVIKDFKNNTAVSQYSNLNNAAVTLNGAIINLSSSPTDANLATAQTAWRNIRHVWEQSEGFLFGPVEDNDYDPNTDTWPTDYVQMDSVLASSNALQVTDIQNFQQSLRGYHPLEYVIFGRGEGRTTVQLTPRLLQYATSLSSDILYNNVQPLYESWSSTSSDSYGQQVLNAGNGSTKFPKKQDLFLAITGAMSDICEEVANNKMYEPFVAHDSTITESPYSNNTTSDFKDNITGVKNVYFGLNGGTGLKDLVASKNKNLDNQIQAAITTAINSFDNITVTYEQAIFSQRSQLQTTMDAINALKDLLDNNLKSFITQYVQD